MTGKQVWYPDSSLTEERARAFEGGGRGSPCSQQQHQTRVRTVAKPVTQSADKLVSRTAEIFAEIPTCGYPTVERCSQEQAILDHSVITTMQNSDLELCGWQDCEHSLSKKINPITNDVTQHNTRPHGVRGTPLPRQRTASYKFQHFLDLPQQHIEHYRQFYSFSTLSLGNPPQQAGELYTTPVPVEQHKQSLLKLKVKPLYRGDLYLRELASRLGVIESIKEPQLLHSPKRTPPSIVLKSQQEVDWTINLLKRVKSSADEDEGEDLTTPTAAWGTPPHEQASPFISPPTSQHKVVSPLELPRIPEAMHIKAHRKQQKNSSSSAISINKYLKVTSPGDAGEGNEEGSEHSLPNVATTTSLSATSVTSSGKDLPTENFLSQSSCHGDPLPDVSVVFKCDKLQTHNEQLLHLNRIQKEKRITNKAHTLRLASRNWSTTPSSKHPLSSYISHQQLQQERERTYPRPPTQQRERLHSRPPTQQSEHQCQAKVVDQSTGQSSNQEHRCKERVHKLSKPHSYSRPQVNEEGKTKLDKLTTIYDSTKRRKSRCASRTNRPPTRTSTCQRSNKSRPSTSVGPGQVEESNYWNELLPGQRLQSVRYSMKHKQKESTTNDALDKSPSKQATHRQTKLRTQLTAAAGRCADTVAPPGATPKQVSEHLARLKRRFEGVLNVQKQQVFTEYMR